jgi:hypothetical protein
MVLMGFLESFRIMTNYPIGLGLGQVVPAAFVEERLHHTACHLVAISHKATEQDLWIPAHYGVLPCVA